MTMEMDWLQIGVLLMQIIQLCSAIIVYDYRGQGHATMPSVPNDAESIMLSNNSIETIPQDAFKDFYQLDRFFMADNPLKEFPNLIPVGGTLTWFTVQRCHMTEINETIFRHLTALRRPNFSGCPLTSLPNVPGPSNVVYIKAEDCQLTKFPPVTHYYRSLVDLYLTNNPMTSVQDSDVDNMEKLERLLMDGVALHTLPYNPKALHTLQFISIRWSNVTTVPLTCPRQSLKVNGKSSRVSLCSCENVWLKALDGQRGSLLLDDMTCGNATTTDEILQEACPRPTVSVRETISETKHHESLCQFPVHSYVTGVSQLECTVLCIDTLGCLSLSFRVTDGRLGNCVIIAPTDSSLTDIPDADSPGWSYLTVKGK